ncbi:MAG TPA: hypothetical protein VIV35_04620, partial [Chitinophagaceae bacterium]
MKKILSIITITAAVAVVMAACNSNPFATQSVSYLDTTGFAQFKSWKVLEKLEPGKTVSSLSSADKTVAINKSGSMTSSETNNAKVAKKKGWSKAAKYSAIGGGSGIILGAVINKRNRVAGGVVGGFLGGG